MGGTLRHSSIPTSKKKKVSYPPKKILRGKITTRTVTKKKYS